MRTVPYGKLTGGALALACFVGAAACQQGAVKVETNSNATANVNLPADNTNAAATTNANANTATTAAVLAAREPDRYRATVNFTVEAEGKQPAQLPPLQVARDGDNRRYSINLPGVGEVVFLDRADKRYLVLNGRRQYVELNKETTGFDLRSLTPGQMVAQMQRLQGVELVGDDTMNGRPVVKYRYATTAKTTTQAGEVKTDNFIYVDKDTGLPLKVEGYGQSTGNVQGVNRGRLVAEMRDLSTDVDAAQFELPAGYAQITQEQIKQQMAVLAGIFQVVMNTLNAQANAPAAGASPTTSATPGTFASPGASPTASASPRTTP